MSFLDCKISINNFDKFIQLSTEGNDVAKFQKCPGYQPSSS